ncbi:MAG: hypothetical protein OEY17_04750 [Nitrosopumilus sp.]|nr:hypothetical protein [Nitrosopumilus sp.]MDH5658631.1 hypothetical protein [Nitrosopumilus sp.]
MTLNNIHSIAVFSIVALSVASSFGLSNVYAEESNGYKMIGDVTPILTFTFRNGVETYEFPVFEMGENFADNSGVSFYVEGSVSHSPLLHEALDQAYQYRFSNNAFDYTMKYFDVDADFVKENESIIALKYHDCRISDYQVETLDSNDYESYFAEIGFAIVDKIDFVCGGIKSDKHDASIPFSTPSFTDFGGSGFKFANDVRTSVTFLFENGVEKIEFPVFNLISGYEESSDNVVPEFQVEGILNYYPLLYDAIDKSRQVSGLTTASNIDFDALVEFTNGESVVRGFDFKDCRISDAEITTKTDKEEGFTGKSGFVIVHQLTFTCSGIKGVNTHYGELMGVSSWKTTHMTNEYVEPIQNTDKGLSAFATFTFADATETIEFSLFKQSKVLTATEKNKGDNGNKKVAADAFTRKATYPTLELRGIVGDYPILYNYLDDDRKVQGVGGTQNKELVDIDVDLISDTGIIRGFNFNHCRVIGYSVSTNANSEESYVKNKFAVENIFEFECQGYHPNNPAYDAMFRVDKANTESTSDLRNTDQWSAGFTVKK